MSMYRYCKSSKILSSIKSNCSREYENMITVSGGDVQDGVPAFQFM